MLFDRYKVLGFKNIYDTGSNVVLVRDNEAIIYNKITCDIISINEMLPNNSPFCCDNNKIDNIVMVFGSDINLLSFCAYTKKSCFTISNNGQITAHCLFRYDNEEDGIHIMLGNDKLYYMDEDGKFSISFEGVPFSDVVRPFAMGVTQR